MSYFVAVSGPNAAELVPPRGRLVAASEAQQYFRALAAQIAVSGDAAVFLWDDLESDTSDDLVCEACDEIQLQGKQAPESAFAQMLFLSASAGCTIHVWWPARVEAAGGFARLPVAVSAEGALQLFSAQASHGTPIGLVLRPN